MRTIAIESFGGAERLTPMDLPTPVPQAGEVLIAVRCAGVNPVDWKIREGQLKKHFQHEFPLIPGWEAAGIVNAVGGNVREFKIGDRVYAYCRKPIVQWGAYAEFVAMAADAVAPMPANLSFAQAAGIPLAGLTAWQSVIGAAQLARGKAILVHAGAGGVGGMAVQFARHVGATVYSTATRRNHGYVTGLGAHHVVDYAAEDFAAAVKRLCPSGVDVVFDTVGGEVQARSYEAIKPGGTLVSIVDPPDEAFAAKRQVRAVYVFVSPDGQQLREIARLIEAGAVKPPHVEEMALDQAAAAQEKSRAGHVVGKIVLRVSPG
jgi:NADPH:quinone reductase-like Zn-dependent oxidoreductase